MIAKVRRFFTSSAKAESPVCAGAVLLESIRGDKNGKRQAAILQDAGLTITLFRLSLLHANPELQVEFWRGAAGNRIAVLGPCGDEADVCRGVIENDSWYLDPDGAANIGEIHAIGEIVERDKAQVKSLVGPVHENDRGATGKIACEKFGVGWYQINHVEGVVVDSACSRVGYVESIGCFRTRNELGFAGAVDRVRGDLHTLQRVSMKTCGILLQQEAIIGLSGILQDGCSISSCACSVTYFGM